jgi:type I restriction enzyme, R subunit
LDGRTGEQQITSTPSVQAQLRVLVKRILRKYKYPLDDPATGEYTVSVTKVLDQAELLADYWTKIK